ncbi:tRNA (adenine-N(1)-)-methyltransferase catalytic subunit trm61 [Elasticomyces elasticus]|nr:tRNA (adenine-N(1)-)-methyltransferase catalytic subunit trm61 [Elasticomyces elasticus]KAK4977269.1 tRNA (adenine-N(1)-)-methyltransferase catalytic subunit trm61 [Elasticomyces elasticus]
MAVPERKGGKSRAGSGMKRSPFFCTAPAAEDSSLAILHLKRDTLLPVTLDSTADEGYGTQGAVSNTRFGSFPHDTLIGLEWGSQVRASKVDTGSRGRKGKKNNVEPAETPVQEDVAEEEDEAKVSRKRSADEAGMNEDGSVSAVKKVRRDAPVQQPDIAASQKRKMDDTNATQGASQKQKQHKQQQRVHDNSASTAKPPVEANSGFVHILQPTPESWTSSLDHRTQVVYTPDYSYILQRLRVKPDSTLIEAGAGSGSFTHAAARAVHSGPTASNKKRKVGKVCSYEYHEPRVQTLREELSDHGVDDVVQLTHRDVCEDGFMLQAAAGTSHAASPLANAIFLDLPAPWKALKHLTRNDIETSEGFGDSHERSPLNPTSPVHICTFSPCIEQVTATVAEMRKLGWIEIEMVEVQNRRIDVRREQVGLRNEGLRGVNPSAASVEEAIGRLREVEGGMHSFHGHMKNGADGKGKQPANGSTDNAEAYGRSSRTQPGSKAARLAKIKQEAEDRKLYKEGNLVHRTEAEVKTHTSYLVFAVLPRAWTEEDEKACEEVTPYEKIVTGEAAKNADSTEEVEMAE